MRIIVISIFLSMVFAVFGGNDPVKVGTYDSRAIAVAYAASSFCRDYLRVLNSQYKAAKESGDKKGILRAEMKAKAHQKQLHMQGFSTAPVDDLLLHIKKELPEIRKKAAVDVIVSKWDKKSLDKYKNAEKKDITMLLVMAYKPKPRTIKIVKQIQTRKPITLKQAENIKD